MAASRQSAWQPLRDRPARLRWLAALFLITLLAGAILLELYSQCFRAWSTSHPIFVTVSSGVVLVALTALVVERLIASIEGKRWRLPSLLAIDAYNYSADRAARRIAERLRSEAYALSSPPGVTWPFNIAVALEMIVEQDRERLEGFSDFVREQADALAVIAMQVGSVAGRSDRFAGVLQRIFAQQDRLGKFAQLAHNLLFLGSGFSGPSGASFRARAEQTERAAEEAMQAFLDELSALRLAVAEERGE